MYTDEPSRKKSKRQRANRFLVSGSLLEPVVFFVYFNNFYSVKFVIKDTFNIAQLYIMFNVLGRYIDGSTICTSNERCLPSVVVDVVYMS